MEDDPLALVQPRDGVLVLREVDPQQHVPGIGGGLHNGGGFPPLAVGHFDLDGDGFGQVVALVYAVGAAGENCLSLLGLAVGVYFDCLHVLLGVIQG